MLKVTTEWCGMAIGMVTFLIAVISFFVTMAMTCLGGSDRENNWKIVDLSMFLISLK